MNQLEKYKFIDAAKFFQNLLLENDIPCYLIGGSLINSLRDNGNFLTNDIDFALLAENRYVDIIDIFKNSGFNFLWEVNENFITIYCYCEKKYRIDFFRFDKYYLNYRMRANTWINEKIYSFQTFKNVKVKLENNEFITFYKPDFFLKTVYGNWLIPSDKYISDNAGDTSHFRECYFYTDNDNYEKIDIQFENLKIFFKKISLKEVWIQLMKQKLIFLMKYIKIILIQE